MSHRANSEEFSQSFLGAGPPGEGALDISGGGQCARLGLDDAFAHGIADQSRSVMDVQFFHHI
jgi:hypothetical protein